jgi:uncharacterized protein YegL
MGFAKYQEDIVSRFNQDNHARPRRAADTAQTPSPAPPSASPASQREHTVSRFKEFTVQKARPLPVLLLADVSGSMSADGKIQALNHAVREMLEAFQDESDLRAEVHLAVITFGGEARVHLPLGPALNVSWTDLSASGGTPMGAAFDLAREMVEDPVIVPGRAYRPTIVLVSDGQPTGPHPWQPSLQSLLAGERSGKSFRMALAIGADADHDVLQAFLADPEARVYRADAARQIRQFFQLVTMSVSARSRSANPNSAPAHLPDDGWDL